MRRLGGWICGAAMGVGAGLPVSAQTVCMDQTHIVSGSETIFDVSEMFYGDQQQWAALYSSNEDVLGRNTMFNIPVGTVLKIPCLAGVVLEAVKPALPDDAELRLVTGPDYAPFTDRDWPAQGMATELVTAALAASPDPVTFSITWEEDWSQHLFPMLDEKQFDMGFPWPRPDCTRDPENRQCDRFHFSDPLAEVLILLFTPVAAGDFFVDDADVVGKALCRPVGHFTHDLDREGREWLRKKLITLVQAATLESCFELLGKGAVDAVAVNEFSGWRSVHRMGLEGAVIAQKQPLSTESLHVVISRTHWRGTAHLYRLNAGLAVLRASQRYDQIVSKHLGAFWNAIN